MNSKYESLTLVQLKAELKKRHAKVSGRKKELLERSVILFLFPEINQFHILEFSISTESDCRDKHPFKYQNEG